VRLVCTLLVVAGCGSGSAKPEPEPQRSPLVIDAGVVADTGGEAAYVKYCAPCHGKNLLGYVADHAPSLINPTFLESASDRYLTQSIFSGRPGTAMPGYGKAIGGPLDDTTIESIVHYIRSHGPAPRELAASGRGIPARGEPLYKEYCKSCHGDASVRGEALHLANPVFQKLATDSFIRYAIEKGRPNTKMLAFNAVLDPAQIDDLIAYIRTPGTATSVTFLPPPTGKEPLFVNPKGKPPVFAARDNRFVKADDVAKALAGGRRMVIVDARPPSDWMRVHVTGAVSIPYHDMTRLSEIPKDATVVAYCACPHHLSGIVVDELVKRGYKKAYVLDEGINVWHQRNYPVVAAPGVVAPALELPKPP